MYGLMQFSKQCSLILQIVYLRFPIIPESSNSCIFPTCQQNTSHLMPFLCSGIYCPCSHFCWYSISELGHFSCAFCCCTQMQAQYHTVCVWLLLSIRIWYSIRPVKSQHLFQHVLPQETGWQRLVEQFNAILPCHYDCKWSQRSEVYSLLPFHSYPVYLYWRQFGFEHAWVADFKLWCHPVAYEYHLIVLEHPVGYLVFVLEKCYNNNSIANGQIVHICHLSQLNRDRLCWLMVILHISLSFPIPISWMLSCKCAQQQRYQQ